MQNQQTADREVSFADGIPYPSALDGFLMFNVDLEVFSKLPIVDPATQCETYETHEKEIKGDLCEVRFARESKENLSAMSPKELRRCQKQEKKQRAEKLRQMIESGMSLDDCFDPDHPNSLPSPTYLNEDIKELQDEP